MFLMQEATLLHHRLLKQGRDPTFESCRALSGAEGKLSLNFEDGRVACFGER
ncbi:MAG: hypothetical protein ISS72_10325 [Candidatus Brocadiae bacterium]|nr:hypothetical protein [Candidatus Brocadiia bacterium]